MYLFNHLLFGVTIYIGITSAGILKDSWRSGSRLQDLSRRNAPKIAHASPRLARRGEPNTGEDLPDTEPHPNQLDQVETAFHDAMELTAYVNMFIETDNDIFPHYFDTNDRAEVQRIFASIYNNGMGNDMLSNLLVQTTDPESLCTGRTLAYTDDDDTEQPFITFCPSAFKKKAVTSLNGKTPQDSDGPSYYATCKQDGGEIDQNVSYVSQQRLNVGTSLCTHTNDETDSQLMNTLGMTLLHEYMHYDLMIASSFGPIVDHDNIGYGPTGVYDSLDKSLARVNADSYAYYAAVS
jgi:hypothetical protein